MLCQRQSFGQLTFHGRERSPYHFAGTFDLVDGTGRFELHPIDAPFLFIEPKPFQRFCHAAVDSVTGITLSHNHEVRIYFIFRVHCCAIARYGILARDDGDTGGHCPALLLQWLIIEPQSCNSRIDALSYSPAHRHDATMPRIAIEDDRNLYAPGDPLSNFNALRHRQYPDIGKPRVVTAGNTRADEAGLDSVGLHDLRVKSIRGTKDGEDLIFPSQELP